MFAFKAVCDVDCEWFMVVLHVQQLILDDLTNEFYFDAALMIEIWNFNECHNNAVKNTHQSENISSYFDS